MIRDRILPLGLRRGIQITRAHFAFASHPPLSVADVADETHRSLVYTPDAKRELARVLAHVVRLCVILTDVLLLVWPLDGALDALPHAAAATAAAADDDDSDRGRHRAVAPGPLEEEAAAAAIPRNKRALFLWYRAATSAATQPGEYAHPGASGGADIDSSKNDSVVLFTHVMYTYYQLSCHHIRLRQHRADVLCNLLVLRGWRCITTSSSTIWP